MLGSIGPSLLADGVSPRISPSRTLVFAHIHCLPSYSKLLGYMIDEIGFDPAKIVVIPKVYSTVPETLHELRDMGIRVEKTNGGLRVGRYSQYAAPTLNAACAHAEKLIDNLGSRSVDRAILLDDGGSLTEFWYRYKLQEKIYTVSLQQTTSGIFRQPTGCKKIMKVNVAGSAAKRWFESLVIASGVTRKLSEMQEQLSDRPIGVIGYGAIGKAVAEAMTSYTNDGNIRIYDYAPNVRTDRFKNASSLRSLVQKSDFIFGCTGRNCFARAEHVLKDLERPLTFASCSSRDVEFMALLLAYGVATESPFGHVGLGSSRHPHKVLNGGFPINFDRVKEWETENEISLTRALVLAGILQSLGEIRQANYETNIIPLGPKAQKLAVETWLRLNKRSHKDFGVNTLDFQDHKWWESESARGNRR